MGGCIPASLYNAGNSKAANSSPRFTGFNPFTAEKSEVERQWGEPLVPGCWPFVYAQVVAKNKDLPIGIKCQVHAENINSEMDNPANYGWVNFGFQGSNYNKKD